MLSKDWAGEIRKNISLVYTAILNFFLAFFKKKQKIYKHNTHLPIYYGGSFEIKPTAGTTHISILDKSGFAVSLTSTVSIFLLYLLFSFLFFSFFEILIIR